jgi:2-polyprenyl-3-methyl-5-hydroxy-6-metoxy-1,4-benzoquinol methylase
MTAFPVVAGTVRMLSRPLLERLVDEYPRSRPVLEASGLSAPGNHPADVATVQHAREDRIKQGTAENFAYVWGHFAHIAEEGPAAWRPYFLRRMKPHSPESFRGRLVLDVGSGSGINSLQAANVGASVVAVDLSSAIDVTRRHVPADVLTVQADAERLPFEPGTFDFVMSMGVLHHLPNPQRAIRSIVPYARANGHVHISLYWVPTRRWHRLLLAAVTTARVIMRGLPDRAVHGLCYPAAGMSWAVFVGPHRVLRGRTRARRLADALPLKAYADESFRGLVGALFDYLRTPIQMRFTHEQVRSMMAGSGLIDIQVIADNGWIADGRRP